MPRCHRIQLSALERRERKEGNQGMLRFFSGRRECPVPIRRSWASL